MTSKTTTPNPENLEEKLRLEKELRDYSAHFNNPDKAYLLLQQAVKKGFNPGLEFYALNCRLGDKVKANSLSIQLLIDYLQEGTPLKATPPPTSLGNGIRGDGNRKVGYHLFDQNSGKN